MGNSSSATVLPEINAMRRRFFLQERLIDGNCDYLTEAIIIPPGEKNVRVGVFGSGDKLNPLGNQGIRIGGSDILSLRNFTQTQNGLQYEFEQDTKLSFFACKTDSICYNLKTPTLDVTREIHPSIRKMYKTMGMASQELDKLSNLLKMQ